jgi:F-type H+-transporting ATPase subunit delta
MSATAIALRYAQAITSLAADEGVLDRVAANIAAFEQLLDGSATLRATLDNPAFGRDERKAVVGALAGKDGYHPIARNFLFLLVDNGRIPAFTEIARAVRDAWDGQSGRVRARVSSATALDPATLATLKNHVQTLTGAREVVLDAEVDPSLIGGIVTHIGDKVLDGSIRTQLEHLRTRLLSQGMVGEA